MWNRKTNHTINEVHLYCQLSIKTHVFKGEIYILDLFSKNGIPYI